jgi:ParB-like chromosome segregation protein Spo0J
MKVINKPIAELKPAEYNPRQLSKQEFEQMKSSLQEFGFVDPVIINTHKGRNNVIVGGHQRVKVWQSMGHTEVPVVTVNLKPPKEKELNVRLNKAGGSWDWDILANEFNLDELLDWGFSESDFNLGSEFDDLPAGVTDDGLELPDDLEVSGVKMVQLFFSDSTYEPFISAVQAAKEEGESVTDTVYRIVTS